MLRNANGRGEQVDLREEMVTAEKKLCVLCAWRENCQKRFMVSTDQLGNVRCPDYSRDVSIKKTDDANVACGLDQP